jgi:hypothetical protein
MSVVLTIRDVPDDVRDLLAQEARERGQSLQAFLVSLLRRQAAFSRNRQLLAEIESELHREGGAAGDAPDAADVLSDERADTSDGRGEDANGNQVPA